MPKSKNRADRRPKASVKSNSWFRMQASNNNAADIFIYDEIGYWGVTAKQFVSDLKALGDVSQINLHINSPGGDVFDGIAIFNALKHHGAAITVHIDGLAASMASVIAMVGNPVIMPENTMMMIHKPGALRVVMRMTCAIMPICSTRLSQCSSRHMRKRPENPLKKSRQCWKTKPGWTAPNASRWGLPIR